MLHADGDKNMQAVRQLPRISQAVQFRDIVGPQLCLHGDRLAGPEPRRTASAVQSTLLAEDNTDAIPATAGQRRANAQEKVHPP